MNDCRPNWYKKYGETVQNWMEGKSDYRVLWKDNAGNEYRFATFAYDSEYAIKQCTEAYPMLISQISSVRVYGQRDYMSKDMFLDLVDRILVEKHNFKPGITRRHEAVKFMSLETYEMGNTPETAVDLIEFEMGFDDN